MKTLLAACFLFVTVSAFAQTITCLPMGQSTVCYGQNGQSTTITPMGSGYYSYGNNQGQMGTIYTPPVPQPTPVPSYPVAPRVPRPLPNGQRFAR